MVQLLDAAGAAARQNGVRLFCYRWVSCLALLGLSACLASCKTPFSGRLTQVDWWGQAGAGTISVSQPKMYRRESLIDERRKDVEWIDGLLSDSKTQVFSPEIVRELELITSFSAALGLTFNPESGVNYRRETETGDIQQQIDVLELQVQLDQLTRDAELLRSGFAAQTEPSPGKPAADAKSPGTGAGTGASPTPAEQAQLSAAIAELKAAINDMKEYLGTQPGKEGAEIKLTKSTVNPSDLFRDKLAYRDLLKAAKNSASLDDLHDFDGAALIRLNFQAMAVPDRAQSRVPGVVQMRVVPPERDQTYFTAIYRGWLDHINTKINRAKSDSWHQDEELLALTDSDLFTLLAYYYPKTPLAGQAASGSTACVGIAFPGPKEDANCARLLFAVPRFVGASLQERAYQSIDQYFDSFLTDVTVRKKSDDWATLHGKILTSGASLARDCGLPSGTDPYAPPTDADDVWNAVRGAQVPVVIGDELARVERAARRLLVRRGLAPAGSVESSRRFKEQVSTARLVLRTFEDAAYERCKKEARLNFRNALPALYVPQSFEAILGQENRVAVYEIGPREQVQQMSSVSRVANSLSLALSLAAAAPRTGLGAAASGGYTRRAMGRAATLERIPGLIGYAALDNTFGWVVMPRAVFDPDGDIVLEQGPRTMDLTVDLSIPAWWTHFTLETTTGWAPDVASITAGTVSTHSVRMTPVPMKPNYADFEQITLKMQRGVASPIQFDDPLFAGQAVSACQTSRLHVRGARLWRASAVTVGGHPLAETQLVVAPDMSGILLTVPPLGRMVTAGADSRLALSVFTRDGEATGSVSYIPAPQQGGCTPAPDTVVTEPAPAKAPAAPPAATAAAVAVPAVSP